MSLHVLLGAALAGVAIALLILAGWLTDRLFGSHARAWAFWNVRLNDEDETVDG